VDLTYLKTIVEILRLKPLDLFFKKIINLTSFVEHESKLQYMFIALDNFGVKHSFANFSLFFQKVIKEIHII
jgi:hypothetical protein